MKFAKIYDSFNEAVMDYCLERDCGNCALYTLEMSMRDACQDYYRDRQEEAGRLMGRVVIGEDWIRYDGKLYIRQGTFPELNGSYLRQGEPKDRSKVREAKLDDFLE